MNKEKFEEMKKNYQETSIPEELGDRVKNTLKECGINMSKKKDSFKRLKIASATIVASCMLFTIGINTSPVFAQNMQKVPLVAGIVKVINFREYKINDDTFNANLKVPAIKGLENKELENSLNAEYLKDNEKLFAEFQADMKNMKENEKGHLGVDSGYVIKTDNEEILSIGRYVVNTVGSSSTVFKYDTIDKKKEILIRLPSLFKNENYIKVISENIKSQMIENNQLDEEKVYWVKGIGEEGFTENFEVISPEQNFFINEDKKLVISFDKYEVAPGYMGVLEFVIPTDTITDLLVGNEYIK